MYRDLGFLRVWGGQAGGPEDGWDLGGAPYAYLVYPHKPIVAYLPQTGQLLNEYCVEFPDETRPFGSARLPDSDDVLAKWMALKGDEERLIGQANLHLPGRQVDPRKVKRDLWRLRQWERDAPRAPRPQPKSRSAGMTRISSGLPWPSSTPSTAPAPSPTARTAPPPAPTSTASASTPRRWPSRSSASRRRGSRRCRATSTCARSPQKVKEGIREAGGTPMELNTIAISDGITMGTSGMKTSLVSREVIADSIELVAQGHLFDALVVLARLRQDDPRRRDGARAPGRPRRPALRRLASRPGRWRGPRRHDPGRLRGGRRARRRQHVRRGPRRPREAREPGRRRLRRAVHRQHDGHGLRDPRPQPDGLEHGPGRGRRQARRRRRRPAGS